MTSNKLNVLLKLASNRKIAAAAKKKTLESFNFPPDSAVWPLQMFLLGEVYKSRGDDLKASQTYKAVTIWAAGNPYADGWGGCSIAALALWRWLHLLNDSKHPDRDEALSALQVAEGLLETRLVRGLYYQGYLSGLPQLEEDLLRQLALLAYRYKAEEKARRYFLDYLSISSAAKFSPKETAILNHLVKTHFVTAERLDLLRGKRLLSLREFEAAANFLNKAVKSKNPQVTAEANLYLANLLRRTGEIMEGRPQVVSLLTSAIENTTDPNVAQKALFQRAIVYYREGPGRNVDLALKDLHQAIQEYPQGTQTDAILMFLASHYQFDGNIDLSLDYLKRLQGIQGQKNYRDLASFKAAMAHYTRQGSEDISQALKLLQSLEKQTPQSHYRLAALFWQGRIIQEAGDNNKARKYFEEVIKESPYDYYAVRARLHLNLGVAARREVKSDSQTQQEFFRLYRASKASATMESRSPYHQRLRQVIESGLYSRLLQVEKTIPENYMVRRLEQIPLKDLDKDGLIPPVALLFSLRQDSLAAIDKNHDPENILQVASLLGERANDWPLVMEILLDPRQAPEIRAAIQRNQHYLALAYPKVYLRLIEKYTSQYGVDPVLIYILMRNDSYFSRVAINTRAGFGLLQLPRYTLRLMGKGAAAKKAKKDCPREILLLDPDICLSLGTVWLKRGLLKKYQDNIFFALLEHHAGPAAAGQWIPHWKNLNRQDDLEYMLETTRYVETRIFLRKTLADLAIVDGAGVFKQEEGIPPMKSAGILPLEFYSLNASSADNVLAN